MHERSSLLLVLAAASALSGAVGCKSTASPGTAGQACNYEDSSVRDDDGCDPSSRCMSGTCFATCNAPGSTCASGDPCVGYRDFDGSTYGVCQAGGGTSGNPSGSGPTGSGGPSCSSGELPCGGAGGLDCCPSDRPYVCKPPQLGNPSCMAAASCIMDDGFGNAVSGQLLGTCSASASGGGSGSSGGGSTDPCGGLQPGAFCPGMCTNGCSYVGGGSGSNGGGNSGGGGGSCAASCPSTCGGNVPEQACLYCQAACVCRCAGDSQCASQNAQAACSLGTCQCPF